MGDNQENSSEPTESPGITADQIGTGSEEETHEQILRDLMGRRQGTRDEEAERAELQPRPDEGQSEKPPETESKPEPKDEDDDDEDDSEDEEDDDEPQGELPRASRDTLEKARKAFEAGDLKKALFLAFGSSPEMVKADSRAFKIHRERTQRDKRALDARRQQVTQQEQQALANLQRERDTIVQQLRPHVPVLNAFVQWEKDRDPSGLVKVLEERTGLSWEEFTRSVLRGEKGNPELAAIKRQNSEMRQLIEQMRNPQQKPAEPEQPEPRQAAQAAREEAIQEIEIDLEDHDIAGIDGFAEMVLAEQMKTFDKRLGAPRISPERAANRIMKRIRKGLGVERESKPPPRQETNGKRRGTDSRRELRETTGDEGKEFDGSDATDWILRKRRQARRAGT